MNKTFFIRLVLLNTFKKRIRVALVVGGIAVSSAAMIVLFGVSNGLHQMLNQQASNIDARDVVTVDQRNVQQIRLDQQHISDIVSISGVGQVESSVSLAGNLAGTNANLSLPVYAVSGGYFAVTPADFVTGDASKLHGNNVVLSTKAVDALGLNATTAIGKKVLTSITTTPDQASAQTEGQITTNAKDFIVVGVINKGSVPTAYLPLDTMRSHGVDLMSQLKVRVSNPGNIATVRESIEQMGLQTSSIQDTVDQINKLFSVIQKVLVLFTLIVFGITVVGTFAIISLTLMEESRQIGFLRISGLGARNVKLLFMMQSILLTTLGAVGGILLGILGGGFVNGLAKTAAASESVSANVSIFALPTVQIAITLILFVGIGYTVGIFPGKQAMSANPLEELR